MLAITYPLKRKRIKVAKWGTPKKYFLTLSGAYFTHMFILVSK
jgi:hypothetical protein